MINESIQKFSTSNKDLLLFSANENHVHDCLIVGRFHSLKKLFSPEIYNMMEFVMPHENLTTISRRLFNSEFLLVNECFYYANTQGMRQYGC